MDELIKKVPDLRIASDIISGILRSIGGHGTDPGSAHAFLYLSESGDGFKLSLHAANADVYFSDGEESRFSYEAKHDGD